MPPANASTDSPAVVRRSSLVELSLVLAAASGLVGGTIWATKVSVVQQGNTDSLQRIREEDLPAIRGLIEARMTDRWTSQDERRQAAMVEQALNRWGEDVFRLLGGEVEDAPHFEFPPIYDRER